MLVEWREIADYEDDPADLADRELCELAKRWMDYCSRDAGSRDFIERLNREAAVETGLIERLYQFDQEVTDILIERGFSSEHIPPTMEGIGAEHAAAMLEDQLLAIEGLSPFIASGRRLSTSYIKELHALFTRHQAFAEGRDQFGRETDIPLLHGEYKERPNNPTTVDGAIHYYCPPEHVAAEMDRLLVLHEAHADVAPEVEAAWLHHRFAQIHPFQDGNGRVSRALATLVFVRSGLPPLVVRNVHRSEYFDALETADDGDLKPLAWFFARLQKERMAFLKSA